MRWATHPINTRRRQQGFFGGLVKEIHDDEGKFVAVFRADRKQYNYILCQNEDCMVKQATNFKSPMSPSEKVIIILLEIWRHLLIISVLHVSAGIH